MPIVSIDDSGREYEAMASVFTLSIYEQEFSTDKRGGHASLIGEVFGRIDLSDGGTRELVTAEFVTGRLEAAMPAGKALPKTTRDLVARAFPAYVEAALDYTQDHWEAYLRAFWAMVRTADAVRAQKDPTAAPQVPASYLDWAAGMGAVDMNAVSAFVIGECSKAYFRA